MFVPIKRFNKDWRRTSRMSSVTAGVEWLEKYIDLGKDLGSDVLNSIICVLPEDR